MATCDLTTIKHGLEWRKKLTFKSFYCWRNVKVKCQSEIKRISSVSSPGSNLEFEIQPIDSRSHVPILPNCVFCLLSPLIAQSSHCPRPTRRPNKRILPTNLRGTAAKRATKEFPNAAHTNTTFCSSSPVPVVVVVVAAAQKKNM